MMALLDTNVIIRFLTSDDDPKYKNLFAFFQSLENGEIIVELKLIVIFQALFVLKSFYQVPKNEIHEGLKRLLTYKGIKIKEKKIVRKMLDIWAEKNIDIVDCYLIACLEGRKQNILYSYDRDFDRFDVIRKEP